MYSNAQAQFANALRSAGIYSSESSSADNSVSVFVHFEDARTKKQQALVMQLAKQHGLRVDVADKGALFS